MPVVKRDSGDFLKGVRTRLYYLSTPMKDTTISLKIEKALKAKLVALAKAENRSLSNFIEGALKKEIANKEVKHSRGRAE
jgi:predicted HicB family RNase H-like nuclease